MKLVGVVRLVPSGQVYKQIFEAEAQLVHSLDEARNRTRFPPKSESLTLVRDAEISSDGTLLPYSQQQCVQGAPYDDSTEKPPLHRQATTFQEAGKSVDINAVEEVRSLPDFIAPEETRRNVSELLSESRRGRHEEVLTSMYQELADIARETEPFVVEPVKFLLTKLMESDRKTEELFKKIEFEAALEGFPFQGLEEQWNIIQEELTTRKKWIREMDESLKEVESNRSDKITDVLRKYTVKLEEISFFLSSDVYRLINDEAMRINRELLANQRAIARLFFNLMESELKKKLSHQLKWQDTVKDWKLIQKNYVVNNFREFMAKEEIENLPAAKTEMENMIIEQISLSERRLESLQRLGSDLLPPTHTKAEIDEWYNSLVDLNKSIDTHNVQCIKKIQVQYEMVQQKYLAEVQTGKNNLLNLNACTEEEAEEIVNSELLHLTEKLKSQFEELEHMDRDFEELAKQNEQNCRDLYSYFQEVMGLWDDHQLRLSQREDEFKKKLDECGWEQDSLIQRMEAKLDIILNKIKTAHSEELMKKYLKNALSTLDSIRARYETVNQALKDELMTYPEAILQELTSYSISISQFFDVKEIFKQNLQGEIEFIFHDQGNPSRVQTELVKTSEAECLVEQQAESIVQENEGEEKTDSCQQEKRPRTAENEESLVQETEKTEGKDEESVPQGSEETELAEQGGSITEVNEQENRFEGEEEEQKALKIAIETFSTSSGNSYTVLGVEEEGKADIPETYFTKYEKNESLPMYLNDVLIRETELVELKKRIRCCVFEHLEKWFAESLAKACDFVAAKEEELNSALELRLHLHQQRQENIKTNVYNDRAEELLLHKECVESHCAGVVDALTKEKNEFVAFWDQQNKVMKDLRFQIHEVVSVFLSAPVSEKLVSFGNSVHTEFRKHLETIQDSMRSYRKDLENNLGKIRDSNMEFPKTWRSFLEEGNFSPQEVKSFSKRLQRENKRIDSFERLIKGDMEKIESSFLEQVNELLNQSEKKIHYILNNRVFMEEIHRFLRNIQVQIRSEVAKSNVQEITLNSYLEKLPRKPNACARPTADKDGNSNQQKTWTSEELYEFTKMVLTELKKRSQYLDCLLEKVTQPRGNEKFTSFTTKAPLQGPIPVATRREILRPEKKVLIMAIDPVKYPMIYPSRRGKSALQDLSISIIQNLLEFQPSRKYPNLHRRKTDRSQTGGAEGKMKSKVSVPTGKKSSHLNESKVGPRNSASCDPAPQVTKKSPVKKKVPKGRKDAYTKPDLTSKKYQIFGEKPPESDTFKGAILNILWTGNNSLLSLGEEFYENQKPQMIMPEDVPETFECFAQMLRKNLLSYQSQANDYYNSSLKEFQDQLKLLQKDLPYVTQLSIECLLKEHEQKLSDSTDEIHHFFNKQMEDWENTKAVHKKQLNPSLGHPGKSVQLEALCQEEIKRQKDEDDGIRLHTQKLQDCVARCAQNFFSALAAFTEKLLLKLDEAITIDELQVAKTEIPREKTSTLIRRKQAGLPLEDSEVKESVEWGSRTWPGIRIPTFGNTTGRVGYRETATVTTAKTTLSHVVAVEARDAAYKKYKCKLQQHFVQIKKESAAQLMTVQRWEDWWKQSIRKIKRLYS